MPPGPVDTLCLLPKTSNRFLEISVYNSAECRAFLTTHARVLLCTAHDLWRLRLREIAATHGHHRRSTHSIATDLAEAGYVPQHEDDRINRHQIRACRPRPGPISQEWTIGELLDFFAGTARTPPEGNSAQARPASEPLATVTYRRDAEDVLHQGSLIAQTAAMIMHSVTVHGHRRAQTIATRGLHGCDGHTCTAPLITTKIAAESRKRPP